MRIVDYLRHDLASPAAARRFGDELAAAISRICAFPRLYAVSRIASLARRGYRVCFFGGYALVYHYDGDASNGVADASSDVNSRAASTAGSGGKANAKATSESTPDGGGADVADVSGIATSASLDERVGALVVEDSTDARVHATTGTTTTAGDATSGTVTIVRVLPASSDYGRIV